MLTQTKTEGGEWLDRGLAVVLAGNLAWTVLCLGGFRPETKVISYSVTGLLVLFELLRAGFGGRGLRLTGLAGWSALGFLGWFGLHVLWLSPVPWLALEDFLGWAQLLATVWLATRLGRDPAAKQWMLVSLVALAVVCTGIGFYQYFSDPLWLPMGRRQVLALAGRASGGFGIPNSFAGLLLLVLPACGLLALRREQKPWVRVLAAYVALVLAGGLLMTQSRGAWLSLALVLVLWPLAAWRGSRARRLAAALLILCAAAWGTAALYQHSDTTRGRLDSLASDGGERTRPVMWRAALSLFLERPFTGAGAGAYAARFEALRPAGMQADPGRAHNEYLDTLAELGLPGGALAGVALWALLRPRRGGASRTARGAFAFTDRRSDSFAPGLGLGLAAFCVQMFFDFHLHVPGLALAFGLCLGLRQGGDRPDKGVELPRAAALVMAAGLCLAYSFVVLPFLRAEALRHSAREAFVSVPEPAQAGGGVRETLLAQCREQLERALVLWPEHAQASADLSAVLAQQWKADSKEGRGLALQAEKRARKALNSSQLPWDFWGCLGVALDLQGRWHEAAPCYLESLHRAPNRLETRYFLAWHFSLRPSTRGNARGLVDACLLLDPFHPQAQALRKQLEGQNVPPAPRP